MDDVRDRLARCFLAVFPGLTAGELPLAEPSTVEGWDSVASVTLMAAVEEEFGVSFDIQEAAALMSYGKMLDFLKDGAGASADKW